MKYPISIIGLLSLCLTGTAQTAPPLASLPSVTISLGPPAAFTPSGTFRHFEVIDERTDTTRIGVHTFLPTFSHPRDKQLVFRSPAAAELAGYLNRHFTSPEAPYTALIVLRNLWLSDASYLREEVNKDPGKHIERTHIRLKAEIYAVRDSQYIPILRFDTLHAYRLGNIYTPTGTYYEHWENDLAALLDRMTDSASRLTIVKAGHARRLSLQDILEFNRTRFSLPIIGNSPLAPGVYASFEEFRNNAPSIREYEVKTVNNAHAIYIKEPGGSAYYYSRAIWGYCDGRSVYIMRGGLLRRTWKEENAFYLLSSTDKELTIDMDTGLVY